MKIIGLSGKARSGKGEFAKIAAEQYNANIVSFAAGVKEECAEFLDFVDAKVAATGKPWESRHLYGEQVDKEEPLVLLTEDLPKGMPEIMDFIAGFANMPNETVVVFTPRAFMQWYGTEFRRAQDDLYWVKKGMAQCVGEGPLLYVFDDCRFPNEANAIRSAGGILVRINRPDGPIPSNPNHPSEVALDDWNDWDVIINNSRSLGDYRSMVRVTLEAICAQDDMERT